DAEAGERGLERRTEALGRRDDERDPFGGDAAAKQAEQLVGDELERVARPRALQEAHRAGGRRRVGGGALEQRAFQVDKGRSGGRLILKAVGWELGRPTAGERSEVLRGAPERRERDASRLVGQR